MDAEIKANITSIKAMASNEAVDWIIGKYPIDNQDYGYAFQIIAHRSWKKCDQIRLAKYYLTKLPFSSRRPYEVFLSFMSISSFIDIVKNNIPKNKEDLRLLVYQLKPALIVAARDDKGKKKLVADFLDELKTINHK